jgi:hypothetical protein
MISQAQLPAAMTVQHVKTKDPKEKEKEKEKERERERQLERERAAAQAAKQQLAAQAGIKCESVLVSDLVWCTSEECDLFDFSHHDFLPSLHSVKIEEEPSPAKPPDLLRKASDANAKAHTKEPATPTGRSAVAVTAAAKADGSAVALPTTPARAQPPLLSGQPPSPVAPRLDPSLPSSRHVSPICLLHQHVGDCSRANALLTACCKNCSLGCTIWPEACQH